MNDRAPSDSRLPSNQAGRWILPPHDDPKAESTIHALVHGEGGPEAESGAAADQLVDAATGFLARRAWDEALRHEEQRFARYGRPVTLVVAELDGLDSLAARLGQGAADRLIPPVAKAMRRNARAADLLARTGHTRLVALLPETDEVAAVNYVERVRAACDMWLEAGAIAVRLAVGWAQPTVGGRLADALRLADDRMNVDRRRQGVRGAPPIAVPVLDDEVDADIDPGVSPDAFAPETRESSTPEASSPSTRTAGDTYY
jgi:diguanylate cyclase (GGDEF)-like protein